MDAAPMSSAAAEKSPPADLEAQVEMNTETETSKSVDQKIPKRPSQIEVDAQRISSSVTRLTSNSIEGLEGLSSELQELQEFLKSEVARVQLEIESAMAGIKIIIETIAPWKSASASSAPQRGVRPFRAGPAANVEAAQSRR
jgi:hypothetical protein